MPVKEVVPALASGSGIVADFVGMKTYSAKAGAGFGQHLNFQFGVDGIDLPEPAADGEGGVGLVGEAVTGKMLGAEGDGAVEGLEPGFHVLTRDGVDEIEVQPSDSRRLDDVEAAGHIVGIVMPFENGEFGRVEALCADADAIDAGGGEGVGVFAGDGGGVCLDGPFDQIGEIKSLAQAADETTHLSHGEKRGRTAAEKDGAWPEGLGGMDPEIGFAENEINEMGHSLRRLARDRIKITVMAFVEAKGNVDV